jgi:hypothetical protein
VPFAQHLYLLCFQEKLSILFQRSREQELFDHPLHLRSVRSVTPLAMYFSMLVTNIPFPDDLGFAPDMKLSTPPEGDAFRLLRPLSRDDPLGMTIKGGPPGGPLGCPAIGGGGGGPPGQLLGGGGGGPPR